MPDSLTDLWTFIAKGNSLSNWAKVTLIVVADVPFKRLLRGYLTVLTLGQLPTCMCAG